MPSYLLRCHLLCEYNPVKCACVGSGARVPARALAVGCQLHYASFLPVSLAAMEERQATVTAHVGRRDGRTR